MQRPARQDQSGWTRYGGRYVEKFMYSGTTVCNEGGRMKDLKYGALKARRKSIKVL